MRRVLHTFDSSRAVKDELRKMSMKKPHARALYSQSRLIDGETEHYFVDVSGPGLHRILGQEFHEHVSHCSLSIAQESAVRCRIRL